MTLKPLSRETAEGGLNSSRVLTSAKALFAATGFLVLGLRATFWC